MPTNEDISGHKIISAAFTLTHISLASIKRGRTAVYTTRKVVLPATKAGMLHLAKDVGADMTHNITAKSTKPPSFPNGLPYCFRYRQRIDRHDNSQELQCKTSNIYTLYIYVYIYIYNQLNMT
jgi:hypothetical protein